MSDAKSKLLAITSKRAEAPPGQPPSAQARVKTYKEVLKEKITRFNPSWREVVSDDVLLGKIERLFERNPALSDTLHNWDVETKAIYQKMANGQVEQHDRPPAP